MKAKPFVKWAGGKGQLLTQLDRHLPRQLDGRAFTYIEPFVGGGAMLFHMLREHPEIHRAVINDINAHLVTAYHTVKNNPVELIAQLREVERQYSAFETEEAKKDYYLEVRRMFNEAELDEIDRTKYLIFLNRTCFNGLYRENAKGKFNVPFGRYAHPVICNEDAIMADSEALNRANVIILNGDFTDILQYIDEEGLNFVYFDPPYRPLSSTSSFNSYVKEEFDDDEQRRLRDFANLLDKKGNVCWMLSNSDCSSKKPEDMFFENIYDGFNIYRVHASRAINANPAKRGKLTELLICNYDPHEYEPKVAEETNNIYPSEKLSFMQGNNHKIVDYDVVLDAKFGKDGTSTRLQA